LNAGDLPSSHENTYIYDIMYRTLFGQNALPNLIEGTPEDEVLLGNQERDLIRANEGNDTLAGSVNDDILYGEVGDDLLRGDFNIPQSGGSAGGDDLLYGGLGNDRLYGQGGNDALNSDQGDDQLFGDAGNDLLVGGDGFDTLTGGEGRDTFAIASRQGDDTITDFRLGEDFLMMTGTLTFEDLTFTQDGNSTVIGSRFETDLAILNGINANDLIAAADSTFVM
jgi:glycerophosphoryl diester phosphodiesterase